LKGLRRQIRVAGVHERNRLHSQRLFILLVKGRMWWQRKKGSETSREARIRKADAVIHEQAAMPWSWWPRHHGNHGGLRVMNSRNAVK
jgi:hypothetical protein